ncbi:hypothetical protein STXM2123_3745 [Streptomyces sp. F-3]|nr:hypothetical protein STXM2123_3745 [Streptomyces sp. F-3]
MITALPRVTSVPLFATLLRLSSGSMSGGSPVRRTRGIDNRRAGMTGTPCRMPPCGINTPGRQGG